MQLYCGGVIVTWTDGAADTRQEDLVLCLTCSVAGLCKTEFEPLFTPTGGARVSVWVPRSSVLVDLASVLAVGGGRDEDQGRRGWRRERGCYWDWQVSSRFTIIWRIIQMKSEYRQFCVMRCGKKCISVSLPGQMGQQVSGRNTGFSQST